VGSLSSDAKRYVRVGAHAVTLNSPIQCRTTPKLRLNTQNILLVRTATLSASGEIALRRNLVGMGLVRWIHVRSRCVSELIDGVCGVCGLTGGLRIGRCKRF